ncbi:MAG: VOC family protein [Acidimicrobiales bacterium]
MTTRTTAPTGAPCWIDLWTSDVEAARRFYAELFGWEAGAPTPDFGGYFMWMRDGAPVAGGMGDMPDMPAADRWTIYLATDDVAKALELTPAAGGQVEQPMIPVADLGLQAAATDPSGARVGFWQPGTFHGFTVLGEPGAPSWFELLTRDHASAVAYYRSVLGWETGEVPGDIAYTTMQEPGTDTARAGVMDAANFLPEGVPSHWSVYWHVEDADAAVARVVELGGAVVAAPVDTPFGRLATITDPAGAESKLRSVG